MFNRSQSFCQTAQSFNGSTAEGFTFLDRLDTSNMTTMYGMFQSCANLTSLDVSNFDTSNVTTLSYMFSSCSHLTSLDLSNFNTSNCNDFDNMFYQCKNLIDLNIDNFDFSNANLVLKLRAFRNCSSLSNNSLNSILKALLTTPNYSGCQKRLSEIGLTQTQAETCTTLSNWAALANKGWTTGY